MSNIIAKVLACAVMLELLMALRPAYAEMSEDTRNRALTAITDAAEKICGSVPTSGEQDNVVVKGAVAAELGGLAKKLANLGISATGDITSKTYEGLLQGDLPAAIKDARGCKLHIFDTLQERLLSTQKPEGAWLGVYSAQIENDVIPGKPIIVDILYGNGGHEPVSLNNVGQPILFDADLWSKGAVSPFLRSRADSCMKLEFSKTDTVRVAYPNVVYKWNLPSDDPTISPPSGKFVATEGLKSGGEVFSFVGCLVYKTPGSEVTHHSAFCFFHRMNQPNLSVSALAYCPWGQETD
jgi:hypothetical protein